VYSAAVPGSSAPLRGLAPYRDGERAALTGRDAEIDELVRAITSDGFRAGLLYGEPGVGKTSLLTAAVEPALRDAGVAVVVADDPLAPGEALARAVAATGPRLTPGEAASAYLARFAAGLGPGQLALFVLDDIDRTIAIGGDPAVAELNEIYARVVGRSSGRARFLFACASDQVHRLGALERRTGSLFPPAARFELIRWTAATATEVLARVLTDAGVAAEPGLTAAVAAALADDRGVLPAELQLAACALRDQRIATLADWRRLGGRAELARQWLAAGARAGGDERLGLRALGELVGDGATVDELAAGLAATASAVTRALTPLAERGAIVATDGRWRLAHPVLAEPVRDLTALERAVARRSHELLGKRAEAGGRLTLREWWAIEREGIAATTAGERAVLARSRGHFRRLAIAAAAAPVVLLAGLWWAQRGRAYLDVASGPGGDRVVVRAGRPSLSAFDWLPSSPGFGDSIADPGLSRAMVAPAAWGKLRARDLTAGLDGWDRLLDDLLTPRLAALVTYASTGEPSRFAAVAKATTAGRRSGRAPDRGGADRPRRAGRGRGGRRRPDPDHAGGAPGRAHRRRRGRPPGRRGLSRHPDPGLDRERSRAAADRDRGAARAAARARAAAVQRRPGRRSGAGDPPRAPGRDRRRPGRRRRALAGRRRRDPRRSRRRRRPARARPGPVRAVDARRADPGRRGRAGDRRGVDRRARAGRRAAVGDRPGQGTSSTSAPAARRPWPARPSRPSAPSTSRCARRSCRCTRGSRRPRPRPRSRGCRRIG
jgi:hypothetical protein